MGGMNVCVCVRMLCVISEAWCLMCMGDICVCVCVCVCV